METKRHILFGFIILLLFATAILSSITGVNMSSIKPSQKFSELIENNSLNDLRLTIYYIDPFILTRLPLSADDLINRSDVNKIVISGKHLKKHIDLLIQINNATFIPVKRKAYLNTRLCYVFETDRDGNIFDVATGGVQVNYNDIFVEGCIFVNGIAVKENDIFYDVIIPFLPEDVLKKFEIYFNRNDYEEVD